MEAKFKLRKFKSITAVILVVLMLMLPLSALAEGDQTSGNEQGSEPKVTETSESKSDPVSEPKETGTKTETGPGEDKSGDSEQDMKQDEQNEEEQNETQQNVDQKEQEEADSEDPYQEKEINEESEEESGKDEPGEEKHESDEPEQFKMMTMEDEFSIMSEHEEEIDLEFEIDPEGGKHAQGQLNYSVDLEVTETDGEEIEEYEDPIQEMLFELTYFLSKTSSAAHHNLAKVDMTLYSPDGGQLMVSNGFSASGLDVQLSAAKDWDYQVNTFYDSDNDVTYLLGLSLLAKVSGGSSYTNVLDNDGDYVSVAFNATPTEPGLYQFQVGGFYYHQTGPNLNVNPLEYTSGENENVVINPPGEDPEDPDPEDPDPEDPDPEDPEGEDPETEDPEGEDPDTPVLPEVITFTLPDPLVPDEPTPPLPEAPVEEVVEETEVEEIEVAQEEPQVEPEQDIVVAQQVDSTNIWWLLLLALLLVPGLIWFLLARLVLVRVPDESAEDKYKTIARKIAGRKDKRWYVDLDKELSKNLINHGEVLVDFRGGLIKEADKAVYNREVLLGKGEVRYALINRQHNINWLSKLEQKYSQLAG